MTEEWVKISNEYYHDEANHSQVSGIKVTVSILDISHNLY
jgi:hypothetical protein